jgi:hypothetical protein
VVRFYNQRGTAEQWIKEGKNAVKWTRLRYWTLTTLREKLIKIGAKVVRHARQVVFQMAEVAVPRELFRTILQAIGRLRLTAATSGRIKNE